MISRRVWNDIRPEEKQTAPHNLHKTNEKHSLTPTMANLDSKRTIPPSRLPLKKRRVADVDLIHIEFLFHLAANKPTSSLKASSIPPSPEETSNSSRPLPPTQTPPPYTYFSSHISPHRQPVNIAVITAPHNLHKPNEKASLTPIMAKLDSKRNNSSSHKPMDVEKASNKVSKRKLADIDEIHIESLPSHPVADKPITLFKASSVPPSSAEPSNSSGPLPPPTQTPPPYIVSSSRISPHRQPANVAATTSVDDFRSMYEKSHRNRKIHHTPSPRRHCIPKARPSDQKPPPMIRIVRRPPRPTFHQGSSIFSQIITKVSKNS
jgi:hypothetical protein